MSVRGTDEERLERRLVVSARVIDEGIGAERAELRTTAVYRFTPWLQAGVEYNPRADDVGLLANLRVWEETEHRPALILGTSSDRIGTEKGRAYYATLSKDLEALTGLPIAPYVGLNYADQAVDSSEEWREVAGLLIRWSDAVSTTHLWDGVNLHHVLTVPLGDGSSLGLVVAERDDGEHFLGLTLGASLPAPALFD